ncbi:ergothioneine biosynthesis PLP-dependent enzyme EgtE [Mycobacterium sp. MS1601]|uniref:ergothioneine biosynthesis PLP-dependent enzyme EgtE n=1 Tax=Mycobacterium sp. MS1601 TaxID=1936029 RepID=UPI0009797C24|nr:ergothioneine biosynthesis PLP-dependent enzyme EgtE [Mycobacterium sp. MS1601]AQA02767.1 ergothioneine biosynthesis PLP-dependent enzyme EgtE [Mycobacterium sp. MS1601]
MSVEQWRAARPEPAGIHLDSAACSRQSFAVIEAVAQHARHEAEVGGYMAAVAAEPVLDAGRSAIAALTAMTADDVVFTTGSNHALDLLLGVWPGRRTLACVPGEFGPNLAIMAANGFDVRALPVDADGRVVVEAAATMLTAAPPSLVHLTGVASHRGVAQPVEELTAACRALGIPLVLDAAQALGQIDCAVGADAVYSSSRKWMAGPRGVGFLAVKPGLARRLVRRTPPASWDVPVGVLESFDHVEANVAARVGFSLAVGEYLAAGPDQMRARLSQIGKTVRTALDGVAGWQVSEPVDEPTAITTLRPPPGVDPATVRQWLIEHRGIVTTAAEVARAPFELTGPVLRVSPHVDVTSEDLEGFASALTDATAEV